MSPKTTVVAPQTKVALMGYILILLAQIMLMIQNPQHAQLIPFLLTYVVFASLGLYSLNCTVVGSCHLYAWITSYLVALVGMSVIVWLIYKVLKF